MKKYLLLFIAAIVLFGCKQEKTNVVRIGAILPMTGYGASNGQASQRALQVAVDSLNAMQEEFEFKIVYEDCQSKPQNAKTAYIKLRSQGVKYFFCFGGPFAMGFTSETKDRDELVFASGTPNMNYLQQSNRCFRICPNVDMVIGGICDFIQDSCYARVGSVYLQNDAYAQCNETFLNTMKARNLDVPFVEGYDPSTKDFANILGKLSNENLDAVYLGSTGESAAVFIRQLFANPNTSNITVLGDMSLINSENLKLIGEIINPIYVLNSDISLPFWNNYYKRFNETPNPMQAYTSSVPFIIYDALHKLGAKASAEEVANFIISNEFATNAGPLSFDCESHEPVLKTNMKAVLGID